MEKHNWPVRKQLPHFPAIERHNQTPIYFVTVCTKNRRALLASELVHQSLLQAWMTTTAFLIGRYVLMPDHLHLFCAPNGDSRWTLADWVRSWKSRVTRHLPIIEKGHL